MTNFPGFVSEKEGGILYEPQASENERQRGFGKFLDTVSSNYGKLIAM